MSKYAVVWVAIMIAIMVALMFLKVERTESTYGMVANMSDDSEWDRNGMSPFNWH
jgi:hypothetical protein